MQKLSRVWRQKRLSLKTKFRIYASCVLPVLLYGSETWTLHQNAWDKLQAFHMRCQRRILRIKWDDSVSNIEVKKCSGLQKCRLGLFGHVARLADNVPTNKALNIACQMRNGTKPDPSWKRLRGRPPKTWCHHILHDVNIPADDLFETARDKLRWRSIATADSTVWLLLALLLLLLLLYTQSHPAQHISPHVLPPFRSAISPLPTLKKSCWIDTKKSS